MTSVPNIAGIPSAPDPVAQNAKPETDVGARPPAATPRRLPAKAEVTRPAQVRFDRYAIFDIGREHHLNGHALWLLEALCHLADHRSRTLRTTIVELAEWTRIGRDTIPKALGALQSAGLVDIVRPFGQNQIGEVAILVWDRLIAGTTGQGIPEKSANAVSPFADHSRTIRGPIAEKSASDQPKEGSVRNKVRRGQVDSAPTRGREGTASAKTTKGLLVSDARAKDDGTLCEPVTRKSPTEDSDLLDVSNLSDEEIGLFLCDREELDRLLASDLEVERVDMTEGDAVAAILRVFPGAELIDEDQASARPAGAQDNCFYCGAPVTPAPASVEHGWSTVCRPCSEAGR